MFCKNCGKEIDDNAVTCIHCSAPIETKPKKKSIFKRWWFWVLAGFFSTVITIGMFGSDSSEVSDTSSINTNSTQSIVESTSKVEETIKYEKIDLRTMLDELDSNALKAERTYQDKYVEIVGRISSFDSDGSYIYIEPTNADAWNFDTVKCTIRNDKQRDFLLNKEVDDKVTIKGQVYSVGEFLGYYIKIDEIK